MSGRQTFITHHGIVYTRWISLSKQNTISYCETGTHETTGYINSICPFSHMFLLTLDSECRSQTHWSGDNNAKTWTLHNSAWLYVSVRFSDSGCRTQQIPNVHQQHGNASNLHISPWLRRRSIQSCPIIHNVRLLEASYTGTILASGMHEHTYIMIYTCE